MVWIDAVRKAVSDSRMELIGDEKLVRQIQAWLGLGPFTKERRMVA